MTGSIVRADNSGLGTLAREFYDNGIIDKVFISPNGVYKSFPERFPNRVERVEELNDCDKFIFFETSFGFEPQGKKILMPMHEGFNGEKADLYLCPSSLETNLPVEPKVFLPVPASSRITWKLRPRAHTFVHNAGHGGIAFRNGTPELIEAMQYVKSDIKLIIRSQYHQFQTNDPRIEFRYENQKDYWTLWDEGDVFLFPEKFNGLSLPIQEAVAAGMLVMCTDRRPFNEWLKGAFIKPKGFTQARIAREVEMAVLDPREIAKTIDEFANQDITEYSLWGKEWAGINSWKNLKPKYLAL